MRSRFIGIALAIVLIERTIPYGNSQAEPHGENYADCEESVSVSGRILLVARTKSARPVA
jgi:hypothetical protein